MEYISITMFLMCYFLILHLVNQQYPLSKFLEVINNMFRSLLVFLMVFSMVCISITMPLKYYFLILHLVNQQYPLSKFLEVINNMCRSLLVYFMVFSKEYISITIPLKNYFLFLRLVKQQDHFFIQLVVFYNTITMRHLKNLNSFSYKYILKQIFITYFPFFRLEA